MEEYGGGGSWYMCKTCDVAFQTKFDFLTHRSQEHFNFKIDSQISLNNLNHSNNSKFVQKTVPGQGHPIVLGPPVIKSEQDFKIKNQIKVPEYNVSNFNPITIDNSNFFKLEPVNMAEWESSFGNEYRDIMSSTKPQIEVEVQSSNVDVNNTNTSPTKKKTPRKAKTVKCDKCDKLFSSVYTYRTHTKIHDGEKRFACEECGKRFTQKINLVYHLRIHTGEKPYSCTFCDKTFAQVANLSSHIRRSHTKQS